MLVVSFPHFQTAGLCISHQRIYTSKGTTNIYISDWLPGRTTVFNAQILNSAAYQVVTGEAPPMQPITANMYATKGFPFFKMYEEPSGISGNFGAVKSIAEIDKKKEDTVNPEIVSISSRGGLLNPLGPLREFRTVRDLKREYENCHVATF
jgi:hypothetical protein